jgi:hypothetical protein
MAEKELKNESKGLFLVVFIEVEEGEISSQRAVVLDNKEKALALHKEIVADFKLDYGKKIKDCENVTKKRDGYIAYFEALEQFSTDFHLMAYVRKV